MICMRDERSIVIGSIGYYLGDLKVNISKLGFPKYYKMVRYD